MGCFQSKSLKSVTQPQRKDGSKYGVPANEGPPLTHRQYRIAVEGSLQLLRDLYKFVLEKKTPTVAELGRFVQSQSLNTYVRWFEKILDVAQREEKTWNTKSAHLEMVQSLPSDFPAELFQPLEMRVSLSSDLGKRGMVWTPALLAQVLEQAMHGCRKDNFDGVMAYYDLGFVSSHFRSPLRMAQTIAVDPRSIPDGDTVTVWIIVDQHSDPYERGLVPSMVADTVERLRSRSIHEVNEVIKQYDYRLFRGAGQSSVLARKVRIRLAGVDAPESAQEFGSESQKALSALIANKCLQLVIYDEDQYGRLVADLYVLPDNYMQLRASNQAVTLPTNTLMFVQRYMLENGYVHYYAMYDGRSEVLGRFQALAKQRKAGLWKSKSVVLPWEWRKANK